MTQLLAAGIDLLIVPIVDAFDEREADFWGACRQQVAGIRAEVAEGPFKREVEDALLFLDANEQAAPLLADLLLARPGHAVLREAVRQAYPDALAAVSELRFKVELQIETALSGAQAKTLHESLDEIDEMMKAVTAYKAMHDGLHTLQPLLSLLRGAAGNRSRWPELRIYLGQFRMQLAAIGKAAAALAAGNDQQLGFRGEIGEALDALDAALQSDEEYEVRDAASQITSSVERGLDAVDVLMLRAAAEASAPLSLALQFLEPLAATAGDTNFGQLIKAYVEFARQVTTELQGAIKEHGRWQQLDRQFGLLQRTVVESQPGAPGEIDTVWRITSKQLDNLCGGVPQPPWALGIVNLLGLARSELVPPISPPVGDQARDRISALISNGRSRFMEVDQALLDWLMRSAGKRPELISLLKGDEHG